MVFALRHPTRAMALLTLCSLVFIAIGCGSEGETSTVVKTVTAEEETPDPQSTGGSNEGGPSQSDEELEASRLGQSFKSALYDVGTEPESTECAQNLAPGGSDTDTGPDGWECSAVIPGFNNAVIWNVSLRDDCWRTKPYDAEDFHSPEVSDFETRYGRLKGCLPPPGD